jgi:hypothetical protein
VPSTIAVTVDNFVRAETDRRFAEAAARGAWGAFLHTREPPPATAGGYAERDTLASEALFDLDAGPVTITLPAAGERFLALVAVDEDRHLVAAVHVAGACTFTRAQVGTRYLYVVARTRADADDPADLALARALQDALLVAQAPGARLELPNWDPASQDAVRAALLALRATLPDLRGALAARGTVDPVRQLIASAASWGELPECTAICLAFTPDHNDGVTAYRLAVGEVPVDAFWSITVYDAAGRPVHDAAAPCCLHSHAARRDEDGIIEVQFGGCEHGAPNCLHIVPGWNYVVRLWRPRPEALNGAWRFPPATLAK